VLVPVTCPGLSVFRSTTSCCKSADLYGKHFGASDLYGHFHHMVEPRGDDLADILAIADRRYQTQLDKNNK
jgi:hypothetical protein